MLLTVTAEFTHQDYNQHWEELYQFMCHKIESSHSLNIPSYLSVLVLYILILCGSAGRYQYLQGNTTVSIYITKDGDSMFLQNIGVYIQVHMVFIHRRPT
jgi:hypothetical protein